MNFCLHYFTKNYCHFSYFNYLEEATFPTRRTVKISPQNSELSRVECKNCKLWRVQKSQEIILVPYRMGKKGSRLEKGGKRRERSNKLDVATKNFQISLRDTSDTLVRTFRRVCFRLVFAVGHSIDQLHSARKIASTTKQ